MALTPEQIQEIREKYGIKPFSTTTPRNPGEEVVDMNFIREAAERGRQRITSERQEGARGGRDTSFRDIPGNVLPSVGRLGRSLYEAVRHPVRTIEAVGDVAAGGASKLGRALGTGSSVGKPETKQEESFDAVVQFFKDRYGSPEALKETLINDPAGFALDVSSVLSGGGAITRAAGLSRTGNVLSKAGEVMNPINQALKGASAVGRGVRKASGVVASEGLGLTTGTGAEVIKEAFRNPSDELTKAMRGQTSKDDLVQSARSGLDELRSQRGEEYRARLEDISKVQTELDITPIRQGLDRELSRFNITKAPDGRYDFSRSTISEPAEIERVKGVIETLDEWGTQPGDMTPIGVDLLKRRLDDFYSPSSQARALVAGVRNEVKGLLTKQVEGYDEMVRGYGEATQFIDDLEDALSLGGGKARETAINKLTQGLRQDKEYRTSLIKSLEGSTGKDLTGQIAGSALNTWLPRGLVGRLFSLGIGAQGAGVFGLLSPQFLIGLAAITTTFSPRIVGEVVRALGITANKVDDVVEAVSIIKQKVPGIGSMSPSEIEQAIIQASRVEEAIQPDE